MQHDLDALLEEQKKETAPLKAQMKNEMQEIKGRLEKEMALEMAPLKLRHEAEMLVITLRHKTEQDASLKRLKGENETRRSAAIKKRDSKTALIVAKRKPEIDDLTKKVQGLKKELEEMGLHSCYQCEKDFYEDECDVNSPGFEEHGFERCPECSMKKDCSFCDKENIEWQDKDGKKCKESFCGSCDRVACGDCVDRGCCECVNPEDKLEHTCEDCYEELSKQACGQRVCQKHDEYGTHAKFCECHKYQCGMY
jgi:hypothetical protein